MTIKYYANLCAAYLVILSANTGRASNTFGQFVDQDSLIDSRVSILESKICLLTEDFDRLKESLTGRRSKSSGPCNKVSKARIR